MARRWSMGMLTAVVVAIATVLLAGASVERTRWELALHLSPAGIELSATSQHARIAFTF